VRLTTSHRKTLLLRNLNRGGQGPIWAVAPLDDGITACKLYSNSKYFRLYISPGIVNFFFFVRDPVTDLHMQMFNSAICWRLRILRIMLPSWKYIGYEACKRNNQFCKDAVCNNVLGYVRVFIAVDCVLDF
jgi:hypothetical protein